MAMSLGSVGYSASNTLNTANGLTESAASPMDELRGSVRHAERLVGDLTELADLLCGPVPTPAENQAKSSSGGGLFGAISREASALDVAVRRAERSIARIRAMLPLDSLPVQNVPA